MTGEPFQVTDTADDKMAKVVQSVSSLGSLHSSPFPCDRLWWCASCNALRRAQALAGKISRSALKDGSYEITDDEKAVIECLEEGEVICPICQAVDASGKIQHCGTAHPPTNNYAFVCMAITPSGEPCMALVRTYGNKEGCKCTACGHLYSVPGKQATTIDLMTRGMSLLGKPETITQLRFSFLGLIAGGGSAHD